MGGWVCTYIYVKILKGFTILQARYKTVTMLCMCTFNTFIIELA